MKIAIPREVMEHEGRVAATPETVRRFRERGLDVAVEAGAGLESLIPDEAFAGAGARIEPDARVLLGEADVILKVKEPLRREELGAHEVDLMRPGAVLIGFLHPANNVETMEMLAARNVDSFTMDSIPRSPRAQAMDPLSSMSAIAGYRSVILAAEALWKFVPPMTTAAGSVPPADFLILGTGVVGLSAIATARRLGARVRAVDIRPQARDEAKSLGAQVAGFEVPEEIALAPGGYAAHMPEAWYEKEREALAPLVEGADVVIASARVFGELAPVLISAGMVDRMRPGSVIHDVAVDQGGNCELTECGEVVERNGVRVFGVRNLPGSLPIHATLFYANNVAAFLFHVLREGRIDFDPEDEIARVAIVTRAGRIVHEGTLRSRALRAHE